MLSDDPKKRKACQNCTKSKSKCSPHPGGNGACYRCQRLRKECVFVEAANRRVPKPRSRVKELEQRVDGLIDLLAANGQTTAAAIVAGSTSPGLSNKTTTTSSTSEEPCLYAPNVHSEKATCTDAAALSIDSPEVYDPIGSGLVDEARAASLLQRFRDSFVWSFPFIVVPASTSLAALRRDQPFLLHAILAVTAYDTGTAQHALGNQFKDQIASRIIGKSHKSLEILQGLLVYTAWYHFFYRPKNQQLTILTQLCLALVKDLGLSKSPRSISRLHIPPELHGKGQSNLEHTADEKRALLGTYYIIAAVSQMGRKRSSMPHTKLITRYCQSLASAQEEPSDVLIQPLIQYSELLCKVCEHFSYEDVDDAEVKGEAMMKLSTNNFRNELSRIKSMVPESLSQNRTLNLNLCLLDMWIHECSLHSSLWNEPLQNHSPPLSQLRIQLLYRTMSAMKSYLLSLTVASESSLHHLAFPSWTGWFYACIMACKLVFLQIDEIRGNELQGQVASKGVSGDGDDLLPSNFGPDLPHEFCTLPRNAYNTTAWDPVSMAKETETQHLFERLLERLQFTVPADVSVWVKNTTDRDPLVCITWLQGQILQGFVKRMKEHESTMPTAVESASTDMAPISERGSKQDSLTPWSTSTATPSIRTPGTNDFSWPTNTSVETERLISLPPLHFINTLNFGTLDFDAFQVPEQPLEQDLYGDWMWNTMMEDFTMPNM